MSNVKEKGLISPTPAERYVIWRRRKNLDQQAAADELEISVDQYRERESKRAPLKSSTAPNVGALKPYEVCYLLRRRAGETQKEVAKSIGLSRLWVLKMEAGAAPAERLREYWNI